MPKVSGKLSQRDEVLMLRSDRIRKQQEGSLIPHDLRVILTHDSRHDTYFRVGSKNSLSTMLEK